MANVQLSTLGSVIKTAYEAEADTNAFTDANVTTLGTALQAGGTVALTANWDVGAFTIQGTQFISDIAIGTAPFVVTSTTVVANLNASFLEGNAASAFATAAQGSTADTALQSETSHADVLVDGDFGTSGLMTTDGAGGYSITTNGSANWDTAYGWGNHASGGYLTSASIDTLAELNAIITDATLIDTADSRLSDARTPTAHNQAWSTITSGVPTTLSGYGISDTKANFDTACSNGNFMYSGDAPTAHVHSESIAIAVSDETTALTTGTAKATFRMPYALTLTAVRCSVTTAPTGSVLTVDINETGTTILSTKLTIDASEKTSTTAATAAVISDSALADDAEITIDIDQVGATIAGAGLKIYLIGTQA